MVQSSKPYLGLLWREWVFEFQYPAWRPVRSLPAFAMVRRERNVEQHPSDIKSFPDCNVATTIDLSSATVWLAGVMD